jgi:predicted nucleic acid-binding protein
MEDILRALPKPSVVTEYVHDHEIAQFSLRALVETGLLTIAVPESNEELNTFVNLAYRLDDGEAMTGSIAIHRNWAIATDDKKATLLFSRFFPGIEIISTLSVIKHWAETSKAGYEEIRVALHNLRIGAPYEPKASHPLYSWWRFYIS